MQARRAVLAVVFAGAFGFFACGDSTGPNNGAETAEIRLQAVLPTGAAAAAQAARAHIVIRYEDGTVALDTTIVLTPGVDLGVLTLPVQLSSGVGAEGEDFTVVVEILNSGGTVVFAGGPTTVHVNPDGSATVQVPAQYTGPGASATQVEVTPPSANAAPGATVDFTAIARDAGGTVQPGAPILWSSLDPAVATVLNPLVGRAQVGNARGTARIRASLITGQSAIGTITVVPIPTALVLISGNGQTGGVGAQAPQPLVVRTNAADGLGIGGVEVTFEITAGGGALSASQVTTGPDGLASVTYTFGETVGPVTITASAPGLSGSPVAFNLTAGNAGASQLAFTTQPTGAVAGAALAPVVVEVRDASGNRATSFNGIVTLTLQQPGAGPPADGQLAEGTIGGTTSVAAVAGVATFANVTVSSAGVGYRLIASIVGVASTATSNAFTIAPRPASVLAFTGQPTTVPANAPIPAVVVEVRDAVGERASDYVGTITLGVENAQATLQGTLTLPAIGGVATFTNLSVTVPVAALRLVATATGITGSFLSNLFAVTQPATVLGAAPSNIAFNVQRTAASPAAVGVAISSTASAIGGLTVGAISYGPGASGWLTATLNGAATPATLTVTPTTPALPEGAFNATIPVTGNDGASVFVSVTLTVTPLPATQMAVITQPAGANSASNFSVQPVVEIRDATGTRVLSATQTVTAAIGSGTGVLAGTVARAAVQGRATFTDLRITGAGAHTLAFTAPGLAPTASVGFTVNAALTTTQAVPTTTGTVGAPIASFTPVTAAGGTLPYAFALSGGTLPAGMTFNALTGAVSGTPSAPLGTTVFTVTVTDGAAQTSAKTFSLTVNSALTTTQAIASRVGTVNALLAAFTPVTASGGTAPRTFALTPGATLPAGLSFNASTGQISGTPTATLAATLFTVTVTDAAGATSAKTFTLTINGALSTTQAVPTIVRSVGTAISAIIPVTAAGGTPGYTFALSGGTLPSGVTFNTSTGALNGTPTTALAATVFTVTVTDAAAAVSSKTFTLTVNSALTTTVAIASTTGNVGTPLASFIPVTASGGTLPYTFALTPGGALPSGLTFTAGTGAIGGTPTAALAATVFTMTVTDGAGAVSSKTFSLTINGPFTTTQAVPTKVGTQGAAIASFTPVTAGGGTLPYTFVLSGGTLPAGLTFSGATGAIVGTPSAALAATVFTVTVTDNVGAVSAKTFTLTVNPTLTTTQAVPTRVGTVNTAIAAFTPVTAANGTVPYSFALTGGTLPTGMTFNAGTGAITGTPTTTLTATVFTVTVTDAAGATSFKTFSLTVNGALTTTQAVASRTGTQGSPMTAFTPVTAAGGTTPYTFVLTPGGTLPAGLTFSGANGQISGTPTATLAATVFTVTVTDAVGATSFKTFTLTVNGPLTTTQAVATVTGTVNTAIAPVTPVTSAGGTAPITFSILPALPAGLTLNATTGALSGTPGATVAGVVYTVTATDAAAATSSKTFTLTINTALTTTQAVPSTTGTVGVVLPTFTPVTAAGGTVPRTFAITSGGALPTGLTLNVNTGAISGTPTSSLSATVFTMTVTDAAGAVSFKTFTLTINGPLSTTQAVPTKVGTVGVAIASFIPVTAGGGTPPYTFALTGGTLPTGMTFTAATGAIAGTPSTALAATVFTVTATDNVGGTSAKTFTLTVNPAVSTVLVLPTTVWTASGPPLAFTPVTASGGTGSLTFSITSGPALPAGLTLNTTTGQISGTPTVAQAATNRTMTATDALGATSSKVFSLAINAALSTSQAVPSHSATVGVAMASLTPVTAANGTAPYAFALSGGTLPTGLSFNTTTGQISGTPTATLAATVFTVTVTDNVGASSSKTFTLTVNGALSTTQAVASRVWTQNGPPQPSFTPVTASGGTAPLTFTLTGGTMPAGMNFNTANGQVSGTPTAPLALTVFTVTVTDAGGANSSKTFSLTVNPALVTTQAIPSVTVLTDAAVTPFTPVTVTGGSPPLVFALSGGTLPTGLSFNTATGQISGTPTTTQSATVYTVTVTDNIGATSAKTFSLTVNAGGVGIKLNLTAASTATVTQNADLLVPIIMDLSNRGPDDLGSIEVVITFDPNRFTFKSHSAGDNPDMFVTVNTADVGTGTLRLNAFAAFGATANFTLRNFTLTAKPTGGSVVSNITAAVPVAARESGTPITVTPRNVAVTINP